MKSLINKLLSLLKYILLVASFAITLLIIVKMSVKLNKSFIDSINIFIPFLVIFILFIVNVFINRKSIHDNMFYNLTCNLVFATTIIVGLRAMFDSNMIFNGVEKMAINYNFFNDYLAFNNVMYYGLALANLIFLLIPNEKETKEVSKKKSNSKK